MAALGTLPLVKALVPESVFKRAKEIASSHKLRDISFEGSGLEKSVATCSGSNEGDNYNLSIIINAESPSKPMCKCSCPAAKGNLCKHVVALLLLRTKELTKSSQQAASSGVVTEIKSAKEEVKQPCLSDTQATEPWVESQELLRPVDSDPFPASLSSRPVIENNRKRVLPSWILGGSPAAEAKTAVERKEKGVKVVTTKRTKRNASRDLEDDVDEDKEDVEAEGRTQKTKRGKRSKEESSVVDKEHEDHITTTRGATSFKGKRIRRQETSFVDKNLEHEDNLDTMLLEQEKVHNKSEQKGRGRREKIVLKNKRSSSKATLKRGNRKFYIESDLSEEDEPEVDDECQVGLSTDDLRHDLDLTTEDLLSMAKKRLEMEYSNVHQPHENDDGHYKAHENASTQGKKESIFSVQGWKEVATKNLDAKNDPLSQQVSEKKDTSNVSSLGVGNKYEHAKNSLVSGEPSFRKSSFVSGVSRKNFEMLESADNVAEDMLGLFFGPSLSTAVNSKTEHTQTISADITRSMDHTEHGTPELVLPVTVDTAPKPKKKGSLKDKVMMFLS